MLPNMDVVFDHIWKSVTDTGKLPRTYQDIADATGLTKKEVTTAVNQLRGVGKLEETTILPTEFRQWWRVNARSPVTS